MAQDRPYLIIWLLPLAVLAGLIFAADHSIAPQVSADTEVATVLAARLVASAPPPELSAHAFISAYLAPEGRVEVLAEKNAHLRWPIASITKLFTAAVAASNYDLDQVVTLTKDDLPEHDDSGFFKPGESFIARDLLLPLLINSSNNAAVILSHLGGDNFINQINQLAEKLNLTDTKIFNPNGLDPSTALGTSPATGANYSSVYDLTLLAKWLLANRPELLALTHLPAVTLNQADGNFHHQIWNTNDLLTSESWSSEIVGGKTGQTDLAGKNLLLILREPKTGGYLINIVLGSTDHFWDMRQLVGWVIQSYQF